MIDKQTILEHADLLNLAEHDTQLRRVASTEGGEYAGACPFCGGRDRFRVQPYRKPWGLWMCRQCGGGKWQNAIDYLVKRDNLDFKAACVALAGGDLPTTRERREPTPAPVYAPSSGEWQTQAWQAVETCAAKLWEPIGAHALDWLRGRGLQDDVIKFYWLGYSPGAKFSGLYIPRGVVIPCYTGSEIWYIKIALLPQDKTKCEKCEKIVLSRQPCPFCGAVNKYRGVSGNRTAAIFGADNLTGKEIALIVEGEFNAMIADQALNGLVGVCSLGAATNRLDLAAWGAYLLPLRAMLVNYDLDQAGQAGAAYLEQLTNRAHYLPLPPGPWKDINDFYQAGGDLSAWLCNSPVLDPVVVAENDTR